MKGKKIAIIMAAAVIAESAMAERTLDSFLETLRSSRDYHSGATVNVQLPQGTEVTYDVKLWSTAPADGGRLAPCDYLIEWTLPTPEGESEGFTAYSDGNLYRHSDRRLQEYHFQWDSIPFLLNGGGNSVQRNAQFTNLLPQFIAGQIEDIVKSGAWTYDWIPDTVTNGRASSVLTGTMMVNGCVGKNVLYVFDRATGMPVAIDIENNPTSISEQVLVIKYNDTRTETPPALAEEELADRYPDVFDNFRESNFKVETLRGLPLPGFSIPTSTGERYTRQKGDRFRNPVVIAFLDPEVATASETVKAIRQGVMMAPRSAEIIFATVTSDVDGAESLVPSLEPGENLLVSARGLARDCGVNSYPTIIVAGTDGIVSDIENGFNANLATTLMEKISVAR